MCNTPESGVRWWGDVLEAYEQLFCVCVSVCLPAYLSPYLVLSLYVPISVGLSPVCPLVPEFVPMSAGLHFTVAVPACLSPHLSPCLWTCAHLSVPTCLPLCLSLHLCACAHLPLPVSVSVPMYAFTKLPSPLSLAERAAQQH